MDFEFLFNVFFVFVPNFSKIYLRGKLSMGRVVHGMSCPWGELSSGRVVCGASCTWGELSMGWVVHGASYPWGELSMGRVVHGASCPWGELSLGWVVHGTICLWGKLSMGRVVMGQVLMGRVVRVASFDGAQSPGTGLWCNVLYQRHPLNFQYPVRAKPLVFLSSLWYQPSSVSCQPPPHSRINHHGVKRYFSQQQPFYLPIRPTPPPWRGKNELGWDGGGQFSAPPQGAQQVQLTAKCFKCR